MKRLLTWAAVLSAVTLNAAPIEISSEPALPTPNLAKNSSFEEDVRFWEKAKKTTPETGIVSEGAYNGTKCYRISGDEKSNIYILQTIRFNPPLPAGAPVCSSFVMKSDGQDRTMMRPCASIQTFHPDKTNEYLRGPLLPLDSHDWLLSKKTFFLKKPLKLLRYCFCYYQQSGFSLWDALVVKVGWVKLNVKVAMKGLKRVKVYGELQYLVFDSGNLKPGTGSLEKSLNVYPMGGYCVEATDASGKITRKFYPKDSKNARTVNGGTSLMPHFNEEKIAQKDKLICEFKAPDSKDKKICLGFDVRSCAKNIKCVAGWSTNALKIKLNGKPVNPERLVGRKTTFTRSSGAVGNVGKDSFAAFYSPWSFSLDVDNPYCPVDVKDQNPFKYVVDITDLVKSGKNTIEFSNHARSVAGHKVDLYLSEAEVFTK